MTLPRIFLLLSLVLFGAIGIAAIVKRKSPEKMDSVQVVEPAKAQVSNSLESKSRVIEIDLASLQPSASTSVQAAQAAASPRSLPENKNPSANPNPNSSQNTENPREQQPKQLQVAYNDTPERDRIELLFKRTRPFLSCRLYLIRAKYLGKQAAQLGL